MSLTAKLGGQSGIPEYPVKHASPFLTVRQSRLRPEDVPFYDNCVCLKIIYHQGSAISYNGNDMFGENYGVLTVMNVLL